MITCKEDGYTGATGNDAMNNILNDANCSLESAIQTMKRKGYDSGNELMVKSLSHSQELLSVAIDSTTLADFKPKTKVEYVSVNKELNGGKFWECARDFSEGYCEFFTDGDSALEVNDYNTLLANYRSGILYRKVEAEITWQDEAFNYVANSERLVQKSFNFLSQGGCAHHEAEFIELCHLVSNANK